MTRILTRSDVASLLTMDDCINAVEDVFRLYGERKVDAPASMATHVHGGGFHVKAAVADAYVA